MPGAMRSRMKAVSSAPSMPRGSISERRGTSLSPRSASQ